eukprot:6197463-Pleurochrysis_carterae.AAC.3
MMTASVGVKTTVKLGSTKPPLCVDRSMMSPRWATLTSCRPTRDHRQDKQGHLQQNVCHTSWRKPRLEIKVS